jgi:16S rRNA G527 N7-methylase RsmG
MPDNFGINEGVKALSGSLDSARESSKQLTKSIEGIQKDAVDVAKQRAAEKRKALVVQPDHTVMRAYKEFQILEEVKKLELRMKAEVINKHGPKAWDDIQAIKARMLKEEIKIKSEYDHDLKAVRRVQLYCFLVAAFVAYYLTWGYK